MHRDLGWGPGEARAGLHLANLVEVAVPPPRRCPAWMLTVFVEITSSSECLLEGVCLACVIRVPAGGSSL